MTNIEKETTNIEEENNNPLYITSLREVIEDSIKLNDAKASIYAEPPFTPESKATIIFPFIGSWKHVPDNYKYISSYSFSFLKDYTIEEIIEEIEKQRIEELPTKESLRIKDKYQI